MNWLIFICMILKNTTIYHIKRGVSIHPFHLPLDQWHHHGPKLKWHHGRILLSLGMLCSNMRRANKRKCIDQTFGGVFMGGRVWRKVEQIWVSLLCLGDHFILFAEFSCFDIWCTLIWCSLPFLKSLELFHEPSHKKKKKVQRGMNFGEIVWTYQSTKISTKLRVKGKWC